MKTSELKKIIKEAVKEAMQEELKEIIFEAFKSNKSTINETHQVPTSTYNPPSKPSLLEQDKNGFRASLREKIFAAGGDEASFTTKDLSPDIASHTFHGGNIEASINGALPPGNVGLDVIQGLLNNK